MDSVTKTAVYVKSKFEEDSTGHDWWHIYRVWQLAKHIAKNEKKVDLEVVELTALLHDIADFKFHGGDEEVGPKAAREWLISIKVDEKSIQHVESIIRNISFIGAHVDNNLQTIEGQIVHDADKLDAIGAIGIARVFAYTGAHGRAIHTPEEKLRKYTSAKDYAASRSSAITHFYEKLLLLKDRMYTKTGKAIAQGRHKYMEAYLKEFYSEWDGKA